MPSDLDSGVSERLRDCVAPYTLGFGPFAGITATPDGRQLVTLAAAIEEVPGEPPSRLTVFDLATRETREITTHGSQVRFFALDPMGRILVTFSLDGILRAGPLTGKPPHLLLRHAGHPAGVDISSDGQWIVSATMGDGLRLWPMPDVARPPLHTLPLEELLRQLRTHTNLRVVPDPGAESGYRVEAGPFPGWAEPPEW